MRAPLDVWAHIDIVVDNETIAVKAERDCLTVDLPRGRTALALWRLGPQGSQRQAWLEWLQAALTSADMQASVCVAGQTIARLGRHVRPGVTSRWLGVKPIEARPMAFLWALVRR